MDQANETNVQDGAVGQPAVPPVEETGREAPRPRWRRVLRRVLRAALIVFGGYYVLCVLLLVVFRFVPPPITAVQLQRRVEAIVTRREYQPRKTWRPLSRISRGAQHAVVAAEDGDFWRHRGFDLKELREAGADAVSGKRVRGASTITQQLMKNLFGCACRFPMRKLYDYALTPPAQLILGRHRILELYLNEVEWGRSVWGIEAAARHYYGTTARRLTRTQGAGLAALLPAPRRRTLENSAWYRRLILRRMDSRGW